MAPAKAHQEMDEGIASVTDALGNPAELAPFFRIPGLIRADVVEKYMAERGIMIWSADFPADDWKHLSASEVMKRALTRLEQHGKGVLLLHDIQPATAMMLPNLLRELKRRGYHIVHVVPASATQPTTPTTPEQWLMRDAALASLRAQVPPQVPLPPIPPRPRMSAPSADAVDVVPPIQTPKLPSQPAAAPGGPRADITDITGAIKVDGAPVTTSNMPKSGIP
jgi:hypothetical protein